MADSTQSESVVESGARATPVPGALLVFSRRTPLYRPVVLTPGASHVVGREDLGGVAVPDERVSRQHAELRYADGRFQVRDLESRNGTFLDGQPVEGLSEARGGAVLRLAQTVLLLLDDLRPFLVSHVKDEAFVVGPTLQAVLDRAVVARSHDAHLLVRGESGSGKELVARRFHEAGNTKAPFLAVNCGTLQPTLAAGEFFGALKGSHSEAKQDRPGYLVAADGGTLFLDEIAELNLEVQATLLRAVETGEVLPLGASTPRKVTVHVVAASHKDLAAEVQAGRFREDLYFRLAQFKVALPPLRERREEVPWLMQRALDGQKLGLHATAVEAAMLRAWPGNVRELLSAVRSAGATATAAGSVVLRGEHLDADAGQSRETRTTPGNPHQPPAATPSTPKKSAEHLTREQVEEALAKNAGNVSAAAASLGVHRTQLYRAMKRLGVLRGEDGSDEEAD
ncbi:MAG: sigma 54-interacting transcriptional regulator [Myxococcota bacterium]